MDKIIEMGNVKLAPAHNGYFLTIKPQPYGIPIEHTWIVTKEELIELYNVLMLLTEHEMPYLYEKCKERDDGHR